MYVLSLVLAGALAVAQTNFQAQLADALRLFESARAKIEREVGRDQAIDLGYRLVADNQYIASPPAGYSRAEWNDAARTIISLDTAAIADLAAGTPRRLTSARQGVYETFIPSSVDRTWIPVAIYIPQHTAPRPSLAIMLHGRGESETNMLGVSYFRQLADRTGTILVAPWGRGAPEFQGAAAHDVYDVLSAVRRAFDPDARHTYLVGYSMGGFAVFGIGPGHSWGAVMDISGAMRSSETSSVQFAWRTTPVYIVTGKRDEVVPPELVEKTAAYLASGDVPVSFYEQPDGEHWLRTLMPALSRAWSDMYAGIVREKRT
jgi:predicted esterase